MSTTADLNQATDALLLEQELIETVLATGDLSSHESEDMTIRLVLIDVELARIDALIVQEHDLDPLDDEFAHLARAIPPRWRREAGVSQRLSPLGIHRTRTDIRTRGLRPRLRGGRRPRPLRVAGALGLTQSCG
jgi:hypothetical protein